MKVRRRINEVLGKQTWKDEGGKALHMLVHDVLVARIDGQHIQCVSLAVHSKADEALREVKCCCRQRIPIQLG